MVEENTTNETNVTPPAEITFEMIDQDLKDGLSRKDIQEKYGFTKSELTYIFQHESLKNRRAAKKADTPRFHFIDKGEETSTEESVSADTMEGMDGNAPLAEGSASNNTEEDTRGDGDVLDNSTQESIGDLEENAENTETQWV